MTIEAPSINGWAFAPLPLFDFDLVVADPPWSFELRSEAGEAKSPQAHYACMDLAAIRALPVGHLVRCHCWLFLWITAPLLPEGLGVLEAWGFRYKTTIAWAKRTAGGKLRMGTGYIARSMHENVLIGAIGAPARTRAIDSLIDGLAREHSRKPDEFYAHVERFAPTARRVELFARQSRPGWASWGLESTKFDRSTA